MTKQRTGIIAIIGAPNAGKSTLVNKLVGSKVSIVTPKVQTTRSRVSGIAMDGETQLVLVDTPGIFAPKHALDKAMVKAAWDGVDGVDACILIIDAAKGITKEVEALFASLTQREQQVAVALNKIDLVKKDKLLALAQACDASGVVSDIFMVSAQKGDGLDDLQAFMSGKAKDVPWLYPEDQVADVPMRQLAAEVTREKLMLSLQQELPYQLMVMTEKWEESPSDKGGVMVEIHQAIVVSSESHKKIIVGRGGQKIKQIGEAARKELRWMLDCPVKLFLFVKVKEDWQSKGEFYREMGLEMV